MQAWEAFLSTLEEKMGKETVDKWLRPFQIEKFDACNLYLKGENSFQISWFEEHVRSLAKTTFLNNNAHPIKIHFSSLKKEKKKPFIEETPSPLEILPDPIDPQMTFDLFVSDEENRLTFEFFKKLEPGNYNPIFLYGPPGVGKSHLLMAIANHLKNQNLSVFYAHAETFTEHVVKAIRTSQMGSFRSIYRNQDVLILDDIHHLARKWATQEELFHTFNALHQQGKQLIFASHLPPSRIEEIEPRLTSRFEWGILLKLEPLSPQKMEEVLQKRGTLSHFPLSEKVSSFLSESFSNSPKSMMRALEALMLRHQSSSSLQLDEAKILLKDLLEVEQKSKLTPEKILHSVSAYFRVSVEEMTGKSQSKEVTHPRKVAMYLCRKKLSLPYLAIGRLFGRDHSTVMTSIRQIEEKLASNDLGPALDEIEELCSLEKG